MSNAFCPQMLSMLNARNRLPALRSPALCSIRMTTLRACSSGKSSSCWERMKFNPLSHICISEPRLCWNMCTGEKIVRTLKARLHHSVCLPAPLSLKFGPISIALPVASSTSTQPAIHTARRRKTWRCYSATRRWQKRWTTKRSTTTSWTRRCRVMGSFRRLAVGWRRSPATALTI